MFVINVWRASGIGAIMIMIYLKKNWSAWWFLWIYIESDWGESETWFLNLIVSYLWSPAFDIVDSEVGRVW